MAMDNLGFVLDYLARWGHFLFGITWIGLLYYFNFVQGEYFKEAEASSRVDAFTKLVPRALWWFRWGALGTFLTGAYMLYPRVEPTLARSVWPTITSYTNKIEPTINKMTKDIKAWLVKMEKRGDAIRKKKKEPRR